MLYYTHQLYKTIVYRLAGFSKITRCNGRAPSDSADMYTNGWIYFNKKREKGRSEDPDEAPRNRIEDLLSEMLGGYKRLIDDPLLQAYWETPYDLAASPLSANTLNT